MCAVKNWGHFCKPSITPTQSILLPKVAGPDLKPKGHSIDHLHHSEHVPISRAESQEPQRHSTEPSHPPDEETGAHGGESWPKATHPTPSSSCDSRDSVF